VFTQSLSLSLSLSLPSTPAPSEGGAPIRVTLLHTGFSERKETTAGAWLSRLRERSGAGPWNGSRHTGCDETVQPPEYLRRYYTCKVWYRGMYLWSAGSRLMYSDPNPDPCPLSCPGSNLTPKKARGLQSLCVSRIGVACRTRLPISLTVPVLAV